MSGLFGQSQPTSERKNIFGTPTGGVFGSLGFSSKPPPDSISKAHSSGGLFGGLGGSQQQSSGTTGGGIFGNAAIGSSKAAQDGSNNATSTAQPLASTIFGTQRPVQNITQSVQTQPGQQQDGQQALGTENAFHSGYFNTLLEKGKKRALDANGSSGFGEVPSLQLGLGDIGKRVRELGGAGTQTQRGRAPDTNAYVLEQIETLCFS